MATFAGINPLDEESVTGLSTLLVEGEYLKVDDYDKVLIGGMLLRKYLDFDSPSFPVLKDVEIGKKIKPYSRCFMSMPVRLSNI